MAPPMDVESPASVDSSRACLSASSRLNIAADLLTMFFAVTRASVLHTALTEVFFGSPHLMSATTCTTA